MKIQIDAREKDRTESARKFYESQGHTVTIEELPIGDYIFNDKVCFEFKLISDFITSIQSGRVFNQSIEMAENYDYNFVIIHGDLHTRSKCIAMSRNYREVNLYQYIGAISSLNRYVTVIQCYSPYPSESYYTMMKQAEKCLSQKPIVKKFPRKHKNPAMNYLTYCVYGVNNKTADKIVSQLELNTLEDLLYLDHEKLLKIQGIGDKLADRIITSISNDTYESRD